MPSPDTGSCNGAGMGAGSLPGAALLTKGLFSVCVGHYGDSCIVYFFNPRSGWNANGWHDYAGCTDRTPTPRVSPSGQGTDEGSSERSLWVLGVWRCLPKRGAPRNGAGVGAGSQPVAARSTGAPPARPHPTGDAQWQAGVSPKGDGPEAQRHPRGRPPGAGSVFCVRCSIQRSIHRLHFQSLFRVERKWLA